MQEQGGASSSTINALSINRTSEERQLILEIVLKESVQK